MGRELRELQGLELGPWSLEAAQLRQLGSNVRALSKHNKFLIHKSPAGNPRSMMHPSTRLQAQPRGAVGKSTTAGWLGGQARDRLAPGLAVTPHVPLHYDTGGTRTLAAVVAGPRDMHAWQRATRATNNGRTASHGAASRPPCSSLARLGCFWRARRCLALPLGASRPPSRNLKDVFPANPRPPSVPKYAGFPCSSRCISVALYMARTCPSLLGI